MSELGVLDRALELIESGYFVFPLSPNSKQPPKGHQGYLEASSNREQVLNWFSSNPGWNLGINLKQSNLIVVDVDMHNEVKNGRNSLLELQKQGYNMPANTYIEKSPNGGIHYFFKGNSELKGKSNVWPGIDLLTNFVTVAPSVVNANAYKSIQNSFTLVDASPVPAFIQAKLSIKSHSIYQPNHSKKLFTGRFIDEMVTGAEYGSRNDWLTSVIGRMISVGTEASNVYQMAMVINDNFVNPPLSPSEVNTIFNSILRKEGSKLARYAR